MKRLSYAVLFQALESQTELMQQLKGSDIWRKQNGEQDEELVEILVSEGVTPPTKSDGAFTGDQNSFWHTLHFKLLVPALVKMSQHVQDQGLDDITFDINEAERFFSPLPDIAAHIKEAHRKRHTWPALIEMLPDNHEELSAELRKALENEIKDPPNNTLTGRLLQSYYACKTGDFEGFGLPEQIPEYLEGGKFDLFERTQLYAVTYLDLCPLPQNENGEVEETLTAKDILATYGWFAKPYVVEMVKPNLEGAAATVSHEMTEFFDHVFFQSGAEIDLRYFDVPEQVQEELSQSDEAYERAVLFADMMQDNGNTDGAYALDQVINVLWDDEDDTTLESLFAAEEPSDEGQFDPVS